MKRSVFARARTVLAAFVVAGVATIGLPAAAKTVSGSKNGIDWTASNKIVAVGSTATVAGGGNPIYLAQAPKYSGVVGLTMEYANGDVFVCSGSLLGDRQSILTAGHCVSGGPGSEQPVTVSAYFYNGDASDPTYYLDLFGQPLGAGVTKQSVVDVFVNPNYTGEVIDQNDIAVLRLDNLAPAWAASYELYSGDLIGEQFNIVGYGGRSDGGGNVGVNLGTGRRRQAENVYDYTWGDAAFGGLFTSPDVIGCGGIGTNWFCGDADIEYSYLADFDNGLLKNDIACLTAVFIGGATPSSQFCTQGVGIMEGTSAGGDSGGPEFIDGKIASVTSYGLTFGAFYGDIDNSLNDTFGEFGGYVSTAQHRNFILSVMSVPEPATWLQMIAGFALLGGALRTRSRQAIPAA